MARLAPRSAHTRPHVLGPGPAWLMDDVPDREVPELDDLRSEQRKLDRLIGCSETLQAQVDHAPRRCSGLRLISNERLELTTLRPVRQPADDHVPESPADRTG